MDLFAYRAQRHLREEAPLAARMRPRTLEEYVGQSHIMAPGRLLRRAIEADRLRSLIFYGPPGTGKTTLAQVIARRTRAHFHALNAVLAGVKDLRLAVQEAQTRLGEHGTPTLLFVDEVHRFNKAQQDALLPWVEQGTVILIGATTENPYFEVNKALVSRSRVFQLRPLSQEELGEILEAALNDPERGYGGNPISIAPEAREHLLNIANGDARALLGALELAVETTDPDKFGIRKISLEIAEESIQHRAVLYDKEGDAHFDIISAYIKSMRGSDPDAALYWLARMVYAGEDPRFILRRLVIFASEDVGLACPEAISVTMACAQAFDRVGMPEGRYHLSQATLFLATAPKSNSTMGFFDALAAVGKEKEGDVPVHLKDGSRDKEGFGHGKGYLYPHAYRDHWVAQQYLPGELQGRLFYQPSEVGHEAKLRDEVERRRDAQLAAMMEADVLDNSPVEALTAGPEDPEMARWVRRTLGNLGERLRAEREVLFAAAKLARHHVVLDLHARTGLLTWEAVRQVPEGGVWSWCATVKEAETLRGRAEGVPELRRPVVVESALGEVGAALEAHTPGLRLDVVMGRHVQSLGRSLGWVASVAPMLRPGGRLCLMEPLPQETQRIYALADTGGLDPALGQAWVAAEEAIYQHSALRFDPGPLREALEAQGLKVTTAQHSWQAPRKISMTVLQSWFEADEGAQRRSYGELLRAHGLSGDQVRQVQTFLQQAVNRQTVSWRGASLLVTALRGAQEGS